MKQFKGQAKEKWGRLTDDDLDIINGRQQQLEGKIQERYGLQKDQAKKDVEASMQECPRHLRGPTQRLDGSSRALKNPRLCVSLRLLSLPSPADRPPSGRAHDISNPSFQNACAWLDINMPPTLGQALRATCPVLSNELRHLQRSDETRLKTVVRLWGS